MSIITDNKIVIVDIETNSLLDDNLTKLHVASYYELGTKNPIKSIYSNVINTLNEYDYVVGHFFSGFDAPALEILEKSKEIKTKIIDTLFLSQVCYPNLTSYSLESLSEYFGFETKIKIENWNTQPSNEYQERCEVDVMITANLFVKIFNDLMRLYENETDVFRYINYISSLANDYRLYKKIIPGIELDINLVNENIRKLNLEIDGKFKQLGDVMPQVPIYRTATKPKAMYKKDGSLSSNGEKWMSILREEKLPNHYDKPIKLIIGHKKPNPGSVQQIKDFLFSKGWNPCTYKFTTDKDDNPKQVPQITELNSPDLTKSVQLLIKDNPEIAFYEGIGQAKHRLGLLEGMLKEVGSDGFIRADLHGITNTLRIKHKTLVNLPGVNKPYGEYIRSTLKAPDGYILVGADLSALENLIKFHYIYPIDKDYVEKQMRDDFDPHLDLALFDKAVTEDEVKWYKEYKAGIIPHSNELDEKFSAIDKIRYIYKTANYALTYNAGATTLSKQCDIPVEKAKKLVTSYRKLNRAQYVFTDSCLIKEDYRSTWIYNPINRFWYELRKDIDRLSTIVQGTGAFVFNVWKYNIKQLLGSVILFEAHDEILAVVKEEDKEYVRDKIEEAMEITNRQLQLNVELSCGIKFGKRYSDVH